MTFGRNQYAKKIIPTNAENFKRVKQFIDYIARRIKPNSVTPEVPKDIIQLCAMYYGTPYTFMLWDSDHAFFLSYYSKSQYDVEEIKDNMLFPFEKASPSVEKSLFSRFGCLGAF